MSAADVTALNLSLLHPCFQFIELWNTLKRKGMGGRLLQTFAAIHTEPLFSHCCWWFPNQGLVCVHPSTHPSPGKAQVVIPVSILSWLGRQHKAHLVQNASGNRVSKLLSKISVCCGWPGSFNVVTRKIWACLAGLGGMPRASPVWVHLCF